MKKYKFTIHFMLKSSKNTYSTELLIPAQMIDNNELGNLDALIGEKAMRKAILDVSAIGEFTVVPQIQQGKEVNDIFFKMKILGFYTEIIHFSMSAPKWENLDQMERWGYMIEQYFEQLEWQVETTQIEE